MAVFISFSSKEMTWERREEREQGERESKKWGKERERREDSFFLKAPSLSFSKKAIFSFSFIKNMQLHFLRAFQNICLASLLPLRRETPKTSWTKTKNYLKLRIGSKLIKYLIRWLCPKASVSNNRKTKDNSRDHLL